MLRRICGFFVFLLLFVVLISKLAFAHEAYVLTKEQFSEGLKYKSFDALGALKNPANLKVFILISIGVFIALVLNFLFRHSRVGRLFHHSLLDWDKFGPIILRLAISASFFYSALGWSFLGPELSLHDMPLAGILRIALVIISGLILVGLFTEFAAIASFIIYSIAAWRFGLYIATYLNYLGEILVLALFGSRYLSIDKLLFGASRHFSSFKKYETAIVRISYGIALCYAAITIKLLHPILTVTVVNTYHLTRFHYLFPSDPLLATFGAALAELFMGLFIIFGFELRLTVLVSLLYITLSIIYFKELVWPHFILYGISLSLLFSLEKFTLDNFLDKYALSGIINPRSRSRIQGGIIS